MTTWTWKFFDALVVNENGLVDVLKEVNYILSGAREDKIKEIGGRTGLTAPDPAAFISFANLTETDLIAIVGSVVDIAKLKAQINAWFDAEANIKPLPFEVVA